MSPHEIDALQESPHERTVRADIAGWEPAPFDPAYQFAPGEGRELPPWWPL